MPKLEPKAIQQELDKGQLWPVYWLYGAERMKSRELLKRIRKTVFGEGSQALAAAQYSEETLDGAEVDGPAVRDSLQSPSLMGGTRFIIVRDAHLMKEPEALSVVMGARGTKETLIGVCVCLSKDLDARKKFSKLLLEKAAVVPCEEVQEQDREAWIQYLAKRRGQQISPEMAIRLSSLDPWSLDIIDQELEKFSLLSEEDVVRGTLDERGSAEEFLDLFFARKLGPALHSANSFAEKPDESLPLLGLFAWNVRQLALYVASGGKGVKLNPYVADKLKRWAQAWSLEEVLSLQQELEMLDFGLKQTPKLPLGLWTEIVTRFCR